MGDTPIVGWFIMENRPKNDNFGVPLGTPIFGNPRRRYRQSARSLQFYPGWLGENLLGGPRDVGESTRVTSAKIKAWNLGSH